VLCSGTSGFVQLAFNLETGDQVAIKFIERGAHMQRIVARELLNHRLCALHPHIVQLKVRLQHPVLMSLRKRHVCQCRGCCGAGPSPFRFCISADLCPILQEVFLTPHHLAIAMEYAAGGDLSESVQKNKLPGVSTRKQPTARRPCHIP